MAAEAEAAREARAKVIAAEGEQKASKSLAAASNVMAESCAALQLRYLQVNKEERRMGIYGIEKLTKKTNKLGHETTIWIIKHKSQDEATS